MQPDAAPASAAPSAALIVESATGVEVSLPVAGPGARALAFVLDWLIRAILFVAWYVVAALLYNRSWSILAPLEPDAAWFGGVVIPAAAIFFLYHYVLEIAMRGRTPGKRMAGVRIVARDGSVPLLAALLTRNVFRLIDSFPAFYTVGLIATMLTRDHVRIGDLAAGTLLVYERARPAGVEDVSRAVLGSRLDATSAEVLSELLLRWERLEPHARRRLAQRLLARHATRAGASPPAGEAGADGPAPGDRALRERLERLARGGSA